MKLLITGGTGLLGSALVDLLAPHCQNIYYLSRSVLTDEQKSQLPNNVSVVPGDITHPELVFDSNLRDTLFQNVDTVLHAAALYDLFGSKEKHFLTNVTGTHNILFFASQCINLKSFHHISSIAVSGDYRGVFLESDLDCQQTFSNEYARTKYESEYQVRVAKLPVKPIIYRPGILIGHSETGKTPKIDGPYYFFKLLSRFAKLHNKAFKYILFPFDPKATLPVLPYDLAARFIADEIMAERRAENIECYHLFSPDSPDLKSFLRKSLKAFGIETKFVGLPRFFEKPLAKMPWWEKLGLPKSLVHYMYSQTTYDQKNATPKLEMKTYAFKNYSARFFETAQEMFK